MSLGPGTRVRVSSRAHDGHNRTPGYLRGKVGQVERAHGRFPNPETRAYGADGLPTRELYLVTFHQRDVWPGSEYDHDDRISADVFAHWLEEVE